MSDEDSELKITRIVHCCVEIDFGGSVVLTDPWFSGKFGFYPGEPVSVKADALPHLAGVVVSHDHYDHNDMKAFAKYPDKQVPIICERRAARKAREAGFTDVTTLVPWESAKLGPVSVTAAPALHGVPEVGYVLQKSGFTVYFAGDTLLIPALSEIAHRFPKIDVALLPIDGLKIFGKQVVMNPVEAAELCELLQPRCVIPTHYAFTGGGLMDSLFFKYFDRQERLPEIFKDAVYEYSRGTRVEILEPGQPLTLSPMEMICSIPANTLG